MLKVIDDAVETIQDLLLISRIETGDEGVTEEINLSQIIKELESVSKKTKAEGFQRFFKPTNRLVFQRLF